MRIRSFGVVLMMLSASTTRSADYFVSPDGNNSNPGSLGSPFATIQRAASLAGPGDTVFVRGGVYRETVVPIQSGTPGAPIRFTAYNNERVWVTGLDRVSTGWLIHSGSIYTTPMSSPISQLFHNGQPMFEARWPNPTSYFPTGGFATTDSVNVQPVGQTTTFTDNALSAVPSGTFNGAKLSIFSGREWVASTTTVNQHSGNSLSLNWAGPNDLLTPEAGDRYWLHGTLQTLDVAKEWYKDDVANTLYFSAPAGTDPNTSFIEARKRQYAFDTQGRSHVEISGINLYAASARIGSDTLIENAQILYPTPFSAPNNWQNVPGVVVAGSNSIIRNSEIAYSWGDGVTLQGQGNLVENNVIHDVAMNGSDSALVFNSSQGNNTINENSLYNAGRSGVLHRFLSPNTQITSNDIHTFGLLTTDLGGTYTWGSAPAQGGDGTGSVIAYNWVHDMQAADGSGIYLDNYHTGYTVHHNVVWNIGGGIQVNTPGSEDGIYNNTVFDVDQALPNFSLGPPSNIETYNNLAVASGGGFFGTDVQNNLSVAGNPFVDSANQDFRLVSGSTAIDYGRIIAGITDGFTGTAPDAGAYEFELPQWLAGANWTPQGANDYLQIALMLHAGDLDLDGDVDTADINRAAVNFTGPGGIGKTWADGDFDFDGDVDWDDINVAIGNFTGPTTGSAANLSDPAVPEPGSLLLALLVASLALLLGRRRAGVATVLVCALGAVGWVSPTRADTITLMPTLDRYSDGTSIFDNSSLRIGNSIGSTIPMEPRAVLLFDLTSIPTDSTINSATLTLVQQELGAGDQYGSAELRRIGTSWNASSNAATIRNVVGDANSVSIGTFSPPVNPPAGPYAIDVISTVQDWYDGSHANLGFGFKQQSEGFTLTGRQFVASEAGGPNIPTLTIDFTTTLTAPDLVIDPATGNVQLITNDHILGGFTLFSQAGNFNTTNTDFSDLPAGLTDNTSGQVGWSAPMESFSGVAQLGNGLLPYGMSEAQYLADVSGIFANSLSVGGGGGDLNIVFAPVGLPTDFNNDNIVDAADYVVWRKHFGLMGTGNRLLGDANGDTNVDDADYTLWRAAFGTMFGSGSVVVTAAVPEPTTLRLVLLLLSTASPLIRSRTVRFHLPFLFLWPTSTRNHHIDSSPKFGS